MHLTITADQVVLDAPQDLTAFAATTSLPPQVLADSLPEGISVDDDHAHLWVDPRNLRQLAGHWANDDEWNTRFEAMIAYARTKGWTDAHGMIRAHLTVENTDQA